MLKSLLNYFKYIVILIINMSAFSDDFSQNGNLIPDWETDVVFVVLPHKMTEEYPDKGLQLFYDDLLKAIVKYDKVITFVEDNNYINIPGVNYVYQKDLDIWIRDFAPLITKKGFYQYIYQPEYIQYSISSKIRKAFSHVISDWLSVKEIEIINDGGNFIHNGRTMIMTDKIYDLNPQLSREKINLHFYEIGIEKIVILPQDKNDITGHADGMVKWIDENQLFVTKYEDGKLYNKVLEILEQQLPDVKIHELDFKNLHNDVDQLSSQSKNQLGKVEDATGIYINFLQTKNAVYVPIYGNKHEDDIVKKKILEVFKDKPVEFIRAEKLSQYGGVINCVTWNVPSYLVDAWLKDNADY